MRGFRVPGVQGRYIPVLGVKGSGDVGWDAGRFRSFCLQTLKGGMKVGRMKDPVYVASYLGLPHLI